MISITGGLPTAGSILRLFTGQPMASISEGDKTFFLEGMGKISMGGREAEGGGRGGVSSQDKTLLISQAQSKLITALMTLKNANDNAIRSIENTFRDATTPSDIALKNRYINDENSDYRTRNFDCDRNYRDEVSRIERM